MDKTAKAVIFHPFGDLNQPEIGDAVGLRVPVEWKAPAAAAPATREEQWRVWRDDLILEINDLIWPTWDRKLRDWKPAKSVAKMEELTEADFEVMAAMEEEKLGRGLDELSDSPNRADDPVTHREMFIIEDDRPLGGGREVIPFGSFYKQYDKKLSEATANLIAPLWFRSTKAKLSTLPQQVKVFLQRPRPYQTSPLLGIENFIYEKANTAMTPSACSGHCLQGLIGVGGVYEQFKERGLSWPIHSADSLAQFAVDIGDRRVMAGVHYPSDNLCSWFLAMNVADRVYRKPDVKKFLWNAIEEKSAVYRAIVKLVDGGEGDVFKPAIKALKKAAAR